MMKNYKLLALILVVLWQLAAPQKVNAQITRTAHGITIVTQGTEIQLNVAKRSAFMLSMAAVGTPANHSVFIDTTDTASAQFTVISAYPLYGIQTSYGKVFVNAATKTWSFYDASGKALIANAVVTSASVYRNVTFASSGTMYGSGNKSTKSLIKTQSQSGAGNGVTDLPYAWNSDGYSALAISSNDVVPATWAQSNGNSINWHFSIGRSDLYLWPAKNLYEAAAGYIALTGKPKIPPKWAFGYLQSRWGWSNAAYIKDVATHFRADKLPVDAFIIDFEWYTTTPDYAVGKDGQAGFSDFNFNPSLFPSPAQNIADGLQNHIKFVGIRKPRLGNDLLLDTARANGWLFAPTIDSRDLDYRKADLRAWYGQKMRPLLNAGTAAWWNDEGESYYSCYYWWNTAENDLLKSARPNTRHFTLNRSFSPGNQRFGYCTWSGDIETSWASLTAVPADLLNFSLAGMYYGSCDIGGFTGTPTTEMLVRWFQAGIFLPIMRSHSSLFLQPRFPYLWGAEGEAAMRKALNFRYQLLPYIYSLGHEAYNTGAPIMRPLVMEFPNDSKVANMTDEWLLGKNILAAPIMNAGGMRSVYLPDDTWYVVSNNQAIKGPTTISVTKALDEFPVYVRAGSIIPFGPVIQYTDEPSDTPLEIHIYPGKNGSFNMVEDDGASENYTTGNTRTTAYTWDDDSKTLTWNVSGGYSGANVYTNIKAILGTQSKTATLGQSGKIVFADNTLAAPVHTLANEDVFTIYPNPATTSTSVRYKLPAATEVTISIYSQEGLLLSSLKLPQQEAGVHENELETGKLKTGVYLVKVTGSNYSKLGKLMIK